MKDLQFGEGTFINNDLASEKVRRCLKKSEL